MASVRKVDESELPEFQKNAHFTVVREIGNDGRVEAVNIGNDRWLAWERPKDTTGNVTYVCINRGLTIRQKELPEMVAELFGSKHANELSRILGLSVKDEKYAV